MPASCGANSFQAPRNGGTMQPKRSVPVFQISSTTVPTRPCGLIATGTLHGQMVHWRSWKQLWGSVQRLLLEGMTGVNQPQLSVSGTSTRTIAFERGSRKGRNKSSSCTCGTVRTLCKAGQLNEALLILKQLGSSVDFITYVCLLHECINMKDLSAGKQVHCHMIQTVFKPNIFLLNTLANMYAKCGSVVDARQVFERMPKRDLFTWNIMIAGYARHGCGREAFGMYEQMIQDGVTPDKVTFICILNGCASLAALEKGMEVHDHIIKAGIAPDVTLDNALVAMYARCGRVKYASEMFDNLAQRTVVSWNAMIAGYTQEGCGGEAFKSYKWMKQERVTPNKGTFIGLLKACVNLAALDKGKELHADIIKAGNLPNVVLETALTDMYAKCGSMKDARQVFDNMARRNVVSWNAMIAGYGYNQCCREASEMYEEMTQEGVRPNNVTYICILNACASLTALGKGRKVHTDIIKAGLAHDIILENSLVAMYAKCGSIMDARQVFDNMAQRNVVSWNSMIAGYSQHCCAREAVEVYEQMVKAGLTPNNITFISVINACASLAALEKAMWVHAEIRKFRIVPDNILQNTLVDMYAKCGSMKDARQVFENMAQRNVVSWSAMIAGYAHNGCGREALETYEQMVHEGVLPDRVTFICVLNACSGLAALEKGMEVHADILKAEVVPNINLENALVDMYAKCGRFNNAHQVFNNMAQHNAVSWNSMIAGYAQHGCGIEALQLFQQMKKEGFKPNGITFICLLTACSHVGLVDEGHQYFKSMSSDHGLIPTMEHFGCMVDLLGRAGHLDEAEDFIKNMPMEPDASVWRTLLGACNLHGEVELAERAAKCLLKLGPQDPGT